jgi:hypothetical protein
MKKIFTLLSSVILAGAVMAQDDIGGTPYSTLQQISSDNVAMVTTPSFDPAPYIQQNTERQKQGTFPLTDRLFEVNYNTYNSGTWIDLMNGDRMWRLKITSQGAKKTALYYKDFYLPEGAYLFVYNENKTEVLGAYSSRNNEAANENGGVFSTEYITGQTQIVEYYEPATAKGKGHIEISHIVHQFVATSSILKDMMIDESDACEVDVNCSEGTAWANQRDAVVRLFVVMTPSSVAGWCSGTLVNTTANDCKKYILTAMHCSLNSGTETTNYNLWKAYFAYQKTAANCNVAGTGGALTTKVMTGSVKVAGANDGGGDTGSDFLLIRLTASAYPSGITPYYAGWSRATTATAGGVGIHHPAGDCKKISTYSVTPSSTSWGGVAANTHWQLSWAATTNGHGVTEGGSSGSPLFNSAGLIIGTLTGGSSFCTALTSPDAYGKMSYHWTSDGTTSGLQLKPWLDPLNLGVTTLAGSATCTPTAINEQQSLEDLLMIYPNPNNGTFNVNIELPKVTDVVLSVFNVVGQKTMSVNIAGTMGGSYALDISKEVSGIYFVEVKTNDSRVVKKINVVK